jgi:large subunit ribosomal protein L18
MKTNIKTQKRERLHTKIRTRVTGTGERPRLAVFRSNRYMYAQLIDDVLQVTLASSSDISLTDKMTKVERAKSVGQKLAAEAKKKNITTVVFDRGGFSYRGRVAALAEGAREGGLTF